MILGSILQATSFGRIQLIIARVITGFGNGLNTATIPMWQAETLPAYTRGAFMNLQAAYVPKNSQTNYSNIIAGTALSNWICFGFSYLESSIQWRFPLAFQTVFAIIVLGLVPFLPESPRYLISRGKVDEGTHIIARLYALEDDDPQVILERDHILEMLENEGDATWSELFTNTPQRNLHRILLGIGPLLMNQWSGINSITYLPLQT